MKLNYRDKIILTIAIVALVWIAGVMFGIKPGIENYKQAQAELDDAKAQLATLEERIKEDEDLDERIAQAYKDTTEVTNTFYSYQQTQEATQKIDDLLAIEEIVNDNMLISAYQSYPLKRYIYKDETVVTELDVTVSDYENTVEGMIVPSEGTELEVVEEYVDPEALYSQTNIGKYSISFRFTGTLGALKEFCTKLETSNTEKTILIDSMTFNYPAVVELEEEEEAKTEIVVGEDGEEVEVPVKTPSKKDDKKEEEEEDPNEKLVTGDITLNMIVIRKLLDPSNF